MKRSLFTLVLVLSGSLAVYGGNNLVDYLQLENGGIGIIQAKLPSLEALACASNSPEYCAANALLAAYYIHANGNDPLLTNAYKHAEVAFSMPVARWEKIYAGLTLATIEGSCYRQNYTNQISVIKTVLSETSIADWENASNPVYSFLKHNAVKFNADTIREFLLFQLVNAYCRIEQEDEAEKLTYSMVNVEMAQRARNLVALEKKMKADRKLRMDSVKDKEGARTQR